MAVILAQKCQDIRERVADRIGSNRFRTWFGETTEFHLSDHELDVLVDNNFVGNWIAGNFMEDVVAAARDVLGAEDGVRVRIVERSPSTSDRKPAAQPSWSDGDVPRPAVRRARKPKEGSLRGLLEDFVVGPANKLAFAAASHVVRAPGAAFKLLVLHGGCGLGKTHLLQGTCNGLRKRQPTLAWRYISGEEFTNEFIYAVQSNRIDRFRSRFRHVDVLIIDDIHFLANKKATQDEFLHTFDAIDGAGKAVVLSSDCHPRSIATLSEPLVNRLIAGMVIEIEPPDFQIRREILARRVEKLEKRIAPEVLDLVATHVTRNVRELEGALYKLVALASLTHEEVTPKLAETALQDHIASRSTTPEVVDVERIVSMRFGVTPEQICSKSRDRTVTLARAVAMHLVRKHTSMSFPEIGRAMGRKNHSTVLMATQRIDRQLLENAIVGWKTPDGPKNAPLREIIPSLEEQLFRLR